MKTFQLEPTQHVRDQISSNSRDCSSVGKEAGAKPMRQNFWQKSHAEMRTSKIVFQMKEFCMHPQKSPPPLSLLGHAKARPSPSARGIGPKDFPGQR